MESRAICVNGSLGSGKIRRQIHGHNRIMDGKGKVDVEGPVVGGNEPGQNETGGGTLSMPPPLPRSRRSLTRVLAWSE